LAHSISDFFADKMSELDPSFFTGQENVDSKDLSKLRVKNFSSDIVTGLTGFGWDGKGACGSIGLTLDADNQAVVHSEFMVNGPVEGRTVTVECQKLWPDADARVQLALTLKDGSVFQFSNGGLYSDIVAQDQLDYGFFALEEGRQPAPILQPDYEDWGIQSFSLRMLCIVSKNTSVKQGVVIKHTVLIFPEGKEELLAKYEAAQSPAWPGLKLVEGYLALLPKPTTAWRCPVLPFIRLGTEGLDQLPTGKEMRRAIGATMAAAVKATTSRTAASLATRWTKLLTNPGELREESGDLRWPLTEISPQEKGKQKQKQYYICTPRVGIGREGGKNRREGGGEPTRDIREYLV